MPWGTTVPIAASFVNKGANPIELVSASTSCGCTVIDENAIKGQIVRPGESFRVDATLNTQKSSGRRIRRVELRTAQGESYAVGIRLNVVGTWSYSPDVVDFGEIVIGTTANGDARIVEFESETDDLVDVSVSKTPWLICDIAEREKSRASIILTIAPHLLSAGVNSATVVLNTSNSVKAAGQIYVRATAVRELVPSQAVVVLRNGESRRVRFLGRDGHIVHLARAECQSNTLRASIVGVSEIELISSFPASESSDVRVIDDIGRIGAVTVSQF